MCCCRRFSRRRIGCGIRGLDGKVLEGGIGVEVGLFEIRRFWRCKNLIPLIQAKTLDPGFRRDDGGIFTFASSPYSEMTIFRPTALKTSSRRKV